MEKPTCQKCGQQHWLFVQCDKIDEWEDRHAAAVHRRSVQPIMIRQPRPDGLKDWAGDRLTTPRRTLPLQTGSVVFPPNPYEKPPEAA